MVFRISIVVLAALVLAGVLAPEAFASISSAMQARATVSAGWLYLLVVFGVLVFLGYLALSPMGVLRIGGEDAEPEFSRRSWFAMLFSAGMGIGLVFWGTAEPLSHFAEPPEGIDPMSKEAAGAALRYAFFHWGFHPWAIYGLIGLAMAWFQFNRGSRGLISDLLGPLIGRHAERLTGRAVDVLAVVATAIGVATTLGFGAASIAAGLHTVAGAPDTDATQFVVIMVAFALYMTSSASGLQRGIRWLSNLNMALAALLLASVLVLGPTGFIFESLTSTLGAYLNLLPSMSLRMTPFTQRDWVGEWTIFYWAWWISWAPFVGAFFARISRGRTVREFVFSVVLGPALLSCIWFAAFGATALHQQIFGGIELLPVLARGYEHVLFAVLESMPLGTLMSWVAIVLLGSFFVTSADSATLMLASMSSESAGDPPLKRRLTWGVLQAAIAASLLAAGGLAALQAVVIVAALPFALLLVAVLVSLQRALAEEHHKNRRLARELRRVEMRLLAEEHYRRVEEDDRSDAAGDVRGSSDEQHDR